MPVSDWGGCALAWDGQVVDCRVCGDPNSVLRFAFVEFTDEGTFGFDYFGLLDYQRASWERMC